MPTYTYLCNSCNQKFELFYNIKDYTSSPSCVHCSSNTTDRSYIDDISSVQNSIIKHDSELKTVGDLANRNRDRMSDDQKQALEYKHNSYKEQNNLKPLPKGMNRVSKPNKIKWK